MISKVKSTQASGTWESKYGLLYKFEYQFEDGVVMTANHKTGDGAFSIGTEVEYEITHEHPEHGKSGKVKKPEQAQAYSKPQGNDDARQLMIVRQSSLNRAVDIIVHNSYRNQDGTRGVIDEIEITELADRLSKWVMMPENK